MALASDITADHATLIQAQVQFLRAFYHFELKKIFNNIPYADETLTLDNTDNTVDAWPKIEADLQFAVANLPDSWPGEPGRANVWAAKALLAKVYMFEKKFTDAYPILTDVIQNGKTAGGAHYALNDHFYSNFNPAQKNSQESVFAAQTSVQDNSSVDWGGDPNGNYGDILNFPYTGGPGACCGFYNPSQDLANAFKTDAATGLPLFDTYQNTPFVSAESGTAYSGTLDPRIDWTMGRPGIQYLDWGIHPGLAWIRNPQNDGNKSPIKNVYAQSQKNFTDVGSAYWGPTELVANNVNIIRFSDVILWAAECEVEANQLPQAMAHVNQVRSRMIDHPEAWAKTGAYDGASGIYTSGSNSDNYKIGLYTSFPSQDYAKTAVRFERRLELAMEGQRFFDLVRWGIAEPTINTYIEREKAARPLKSDAHFTANKNEYMPIPQSEIDNLNSDGVTRLKQNQGYQ
jgi:hypothetical protein